MYVPSKDGHIFDKYIPSSIIDTSCFSFFQKYHVTPSWSKECLNQGVWFGFDFRSFYIAQLNASFYTKAQ